MIDDFDDVCDSCGHDHSQSHDSHFGITPSQFVKTVKKLHVAGWLEAIDIYEASIDFSYKADDQAYKKTIDTNVTENLDFILTQLELNKVPYSCHIVGS